MKMSNDPAKYEVLIKEYLRSILDKSEPKTANFCCILFTRSQSAFRFHKGLNNTRHKREANSRDISYPKVRRLRHRLKI